MNSLYVPMNASSEMSIRDSCVQDIHLERAFVYVIDTNLKVFAEAIHVLSSISEQILLQPLPDSIVMSAANSTKSAYGKVTLANNFFTRTEAPWGGAENRGEPGAEGDVQCRICTRSALHIFKNVMAKNVGLPSFDTCQLELDPRADFAIVHLKQAHGEIRRVYVLPMREQMAPVNNVFVERQRLKNRAATQPKVLLNSLAGLDCREMKLVASATQFSAQRYVMREDFNKVRKTEVSIPVDHFEPYHIEVDSQLVVSLKELRSILQFADICGMPLTLHFDRPGRPVIVAVEETIEFRAEFVLATLDEAVEVERNNHAGPQQQRQAQQRQLVQQLDPTQMQTPEQQHPNTPSLLRRQQHLLKPARVIPETPPQQMAANVIRKRPLRQQENSHNNNQNQSPFQSSSLC